MAELICSACYLPSTIGIFSQSTEDRQDKEMWKRTASPVFFAANVLTVFMSFSVLY